MTNAGRKTFGAAPPMGVPFFSSAGGKRFARAVYFALLLCAAVLFPGACGGEGGKTLVVGDIGWTENTAVANLTKVLLEEELGYEDVTIRAVTLDRVFEEVSNGDLDAFQDVWLPNHQELLDEQGGGTQLLDNWFRGITTLGLAVPEYMDVTSMEDLDESGAELIVGIEPESVINGLIVDEIMPTYGLDQSLVEASTQGMLAEVERLYNGGEEFVFVAWRPHWMNQAYDFRYLADPEDTLGDLDLTAEVSTVVNRNLPEEDPVAYALVEALSLNEEQLNSLENEIEASGDPAIGAAAWLANNRDVVEPWLRVARVADF